MTQTVLDPNEVRFFSGSSHPQLAADIVADLGLPLDKTHIRRFSNDILYIQLDASVRSRAVYIVQSLTPPVNDHLVELLMMLDIARSASAKEIHAIIPYFSFARSDKKDAPRISITARLVADLIQTAGATHVMTMMLHSPQVHGFFSIPADPLTSRPVFNRHFEDATCLAPLWWLRIWGTPNPQHASQKVWGCQWLLAIRSAFPIPRCKSAGWWGGPFKDIGGLSSLTMKFPQAVPSSGSARF
jgi:hypothetical protein